MKSFSEFLDEAKQVGILYHFTLLPRLIYMLKFEDFIVKSNNNETFSLTRNPRLSDVIGHPVINIRNEYYVRINIDGDKLSERVKIRPVLGLIDNSSGVFDFNNKKRVSRKWEEMEEVIPVGTNIRPYIKSVSILAYPSEELNEAVSLLKKLGIKYSIDKKWPLINEWEFCNEI